MDLIDQMRQLAANIKNQTNYLQNEEATKTACVMPFIQALGYNVFDPTEVVPEFTADFGTKKGEKVDYAIKRDGKAIILIECKKFGTDLSAVQASQLFRYFSVAEARIGILTNGVEFRIFADLENKNKMDDNPFLVLNILSISDSDVKEIKKFTKSAFDIDKLITDAGKLKYSRGIRTYLLDQYENPDDEFVRFLAKMVYPGRLTTSVMESFQEITKQAFKRFVSEVISGKLEAAFTEDEGEVKSEDVPGTEGVRDDGIVTTEEELEGYYIVKAILRKKFDISKLAHKDTRSYFGILYDNNTWKPVCRLHFNNPSNKAITLFSFDESGKREDRVEKLHHLEDIYNFEKEIMSVVEHYSNS